MSNGETTPQQAGFDAEAFHALCGQRSEAFKVAKKQGNRWFPPDTSKNEDHVVELVDVFLLQVKDQNEGDIPAFKLTFRIADNSHMDSEGKATLLNRKFASFQRLGSKSIGVASGVIASVYGAEACPDELGPALMGMKAFARNGDQPGCVYMVAVKTKNPDYDPNVYINKCLGRGQQTTSEPPAEESTDPSPAGEPVAEPAAEAA
jgi:hypothetical protein